MPIEGVLTLEPYPTLRAADTTTGASAGRSERAWLLVSSGKFGAADRAHAALGEVAILRLEPDSITLGPSRDAR